MGKTEQHVSSTAVATNVCPELQLTANDYVQIREDAEHYYIDVGRSEEMNSMLTAAYERVQDLEDRYSKTLRTILTKLQTGQINAGPNGQEPTPLIMATPSKSRARAKRPAPASSSTNKVILHRAKARNSAEETTGTVSASTLGRGRKLFTGKGNNNKHQVLQESVTRIEANLEMMTEMSIDASKASSSKAKKPFIAMEQSALASGQTIADSSTSAVNTTTIRTRSQARLAAAAGASASKTLASASRPEPMSSTKTSRSRKVADQQQQASGSFIRTKDSTSNLRPPALNLTPSKPGSSRLIDLSGGGSVGKKKKPTATTTSASSVHNTTPVKQARAPGGGTPSAARRQEMEKNLQEKLVMSEDKRKKADENKKMLLETRAQRLKEDREKRLEKIRMNKAALEQQQQAKVGHEHVVASSSKPLSKQEQRNAERRRKLAEIEAQAKEDKKKPKMTRAAAKKAAAAEAAAASRQQQQQQKQQTSDSKSGSKSRLKGTKATTTTVEEKKPAATLAIDSEPLPPGPSGLSPIARPSTSAQAGINTRLNETFTTEAVTGSGPIASQDAASTPAHSTFTNGQPQENVTFAVPAIPPPPKTPNSTPNVAKKLIGGQTPTTYEMTPPPRERTADNYDISKYIDSDDEEQQAQHQQQGQKRVPKWAQGRDFLSRIHGQFGKTADELVAIQGRIFPPPPLPVPLEEMGLPVRERYQVRTSSVNWNQARVIEEAVAKLGGHK